MPESKAEAPAQRRRVAARVVRIPVRALRGLDMFERVKNERDATHYAIPVDELAARHGLGSTAPTEPIVLSRAEAKHIRRRLAAPAGEWIAWEDAKLQLAGGRIARARRAAGLTQRELARRLGMPQSQISRIERNPDHTTVRTIRKVAAALKVDVSTLIEHE